MTREEQLNAAERRAAEGVLAAAERGKARRRLVAPVAAAEQHEE